MVCRACCALAVRATTTTSLKPESCAASASRCALSRMLMATRTASGACCASMLHLLSRCRANSSHSNVDTKLNAPRPADRGAAEERSLQQILLIERILDIELRPDYRRS